MLGSGIVLLGLIAATLPYWFSYALRPVARHFGVEYRDFLSLSKDRFALTEVRGKIGTVAFSALRVEGFVPWKWKTRLTQNATNEAPPIFLTVNGWTVQVSPSNATPSTNSPYGFLQLFERQIGQLNQWLPHALFSNGTFRWKNTEFASTTIVLQHGEVAGDITFPQATASADFKGDFSNSLTNTISVRVDSWDVRTRFRIVNRPEAATLTLTGMWKTNRISGSAVLKPNETIPQEAHLISDGITLPAEILKADGYESFTIKFNGDWQTNQFNTAIDVHAQPAEVADKKRPGFDISAAAHGNLNQATLDRARVFAPWLEANLEKSVTFDYKGNLEAFDVPFRMKADMSQQTWLPLQGFLEGVVRLNPGTIREPNLRFSLGGRQINGYGLEEAALKMSGQLRWPLLHIDEGSFSQTNGAAGTFTGQINLETRELSPSHFAFSGKVGDSALLPKGFDYQAAQVSADVTGFWPKLHHSGTITITNLTYAALTNASVSAKWRGVYPDLESLETSLRSGTNQFQLSAALHILPGETNLTVETLTWQGGDRLMLGASAPFEIDVGANTNSVNGQDHLPELRVKRLKIAGQGAVVSIDAAIAWPDRGQLQISATNLNSVMVAPLTARPIPEIHLPRLILTASWDHGPLQMDLNLLYSAAVRELGLVNTSLDFQADNTGLSVNGLNVSAASGTILRAEGTLPVRIYPGGSQGKHLQISGSREV
ncbi:MAG: hypothetical protein JWM99_4582, partial [Verrucomicrobiales bacterium]|nr:hypothetical protein [Verrucomicrobiales bacterium]